MDKKYTVCIDIHILDMFNEHFSLVQALIFYSKKKTIINYINGLRKCKKKECERMEISVR